MAATIFKVIDIFLNEIINKRLNPDGSDSSVIVLPEMFARDKYVINFRVYENQIIRYPFKSNSKINLSVKARSNSTPVLAQAIDVDFATSAWDAADAYTIIPMTSIVGTFLVDNLVTESTSGATGRVFFNDTVNKRLFLKNVSGTFTGSETITETLQSGVSGATATSGTPEIEAHDRTKGKVGCTIDLNTTNLKNEMSGRQEIDTVWELVEDFDDGTKRIIGQFNVILKESLLDSDEAEEQLALAIASNKLTANLNLNGFNILTSAGLVAFAPKITSYFDVRLASTILNVTGDGTNYDVIFDTEVADVGNDFNIATGIFKAPVKGLYAFTVSARLFGLTSSHTDIAASLSGPTELANLSSMGNIVDHEDVNDALSGAAIVILDVDETVKLIVRVTGGAIVVDIAAGARMGGYLITTVP